MTTRKKVLEQISRVSSEDEFYFPIGKTNGISLNESDALAAKIILWVSKEFPNKTIGELLDGLDFARWWLMYFGSELTIENIEE